jgi:outer membrane protein
MLKKFLLALALFSFVLPIDAAPASATETRIGVVDLQRALNTVREGRDARQRLERDLERRRREFEESQTALQAEVQEFEAAASMLTQEAAMQRYQSLQQRAMELQQSYEGHQRELSRSEAEATERIAERMFAIVRTLAQEQNYSLVLDRSTIVFIQEGTDLTDELIRRYDAAH